MEPDHEARAEDVLRRKNRRGAKIWQLVIPKNVREMFGLSGGQRLIVLTDDKEGIALVPAKVFEDKMKHALEFAVVKPEEYRNKHSVRRSFKRNLEAAFFTVA